MGNSDGLHVGRFQIQNFQDQISWVTPKTGQALRGDSNSALIDITLRVRKQVGRYWITSLACSIRTNSLTPAILCNITRNIDSNAGNITGIWLIQGSRVLVDDNSTPDLVFATIDAAESICRRLFPNARIQGHLIGEAQRTDHAGNTFMFGLAGAVTSAVLDAARHKAAVMNFLNGELVSRDGRRLGTFATAKGWSIELG